MSNEVTKVSDNAALEALAGIGATGFENVDVRDLLIPKLTILQGLSPQVTQGKPEFDKNARVGDIYDVGLQERFPEGVEIVVAHFDKVWNEWLPQRGTRPPVHQHPTAEILEKTRVNDLNQNVLPNGNMIVETQQFYVINLTAQRRKSFLPMSITQIKKGKRLLTLAQSERVMINGEEKMPGLFWRTYMLTTVPESNIKGTWMGWKIERGTLLKERDDFTSLVKEIKDLRDAVVEGRARGDYTGEEGGGSEDRPF